MHHATALEVEQAEQQREAKKQEKFLHKHATEEIYGKSKEEFLVTQEQAKKHERQRSKAYLSQLNLYMMLMPSSVIRLTWDGISMLLVFFIAISLPYRVAFLIDCPSTGFAVADFMIDIFFILDILLNFRTAVVIDGELLTSTFVVARRYLAFWFWFDLVSSLPFDWFIQDGLIETGFSFDTLECKLGPDVYRLLTVNASGTGANATLLSASADLSVTSQTFSFFKIFKVVKLLRLLRIARLFRYLAKFEEHFIQFNSSTLRMAKLSLLLLIFSHWNGCCQFLIAALTRSDDGVFPNDSWVHRAGIAFEPPDVQWSWAFFHAASQLLAISVGVVPPQTVGEIYLYLISMLLGATMYAVFVASVTAFFADADPSAREYRAKVDMVNQYMRHSQLPAALRAKLRTYYELRYPGGRAFDEVKIHTELSSPLTQEVRVHKCRQVLSALNIIDADVTLSAALCEHLVRVVFVTGDFIIRQAEISDGMYFVSSGSVEILVKQEARDAEAEVITTLGSHAFFGEMALFNPTGKATASVRVITYFEGYMLSYDNYLKIVHNHPSFQAYLQAAAKLRLRKRHDLAGESKEADINHLFAMLDPTKRKLIKLERNLEREREAHGPISPSEASDTAEKPQRAGLTRSLTRKLNFTADEKSEKSEARKMKLVRTCTNKLKIAAKV